MADIFDLFRSIAKPAQSGANAPVTFLAVGLGNPGDEYENTRHNAGFVALDCLAADLGVTVNRLKFKALIGEGESDGVRLLLMKPQTFMNLSGEAVAAAAAFYKIPPQRVLVLCDDVSFAPGRLRIRRQGSAGGHNGLKSIIACLGTDAFPRFRLGVGQKPTPEYDMADWVLGRLGREDRENLAKAAEAAADAVRLWVAGKEEEAMTRHSK